MQRQLTSILAIAGSDCSGGAGIQADIRAAALRGVFAATAVTAVTVQNSHGLSDIVVMSPETVIGQVKAVFQDSRPSAIKIGMIGSLENGLALVRFLKDCTDGIPVVIDPVMKATAGGCLSAREENMVSFYKEEFCPLATAVTPNLEEAKLFGAEGGTPAEQALSLLSMLRCKAVVLKGGHSEEDTITDTMAFRHGSLRPEAAESEEIDTISGQKIDCKNLHGTGCTYSSIMAAELAKGHTIKDAFRMASLSMKDIISRSTGYFLGHSGYGPLNLFGYHTSLQ